MNLTDVNSFLEKVYEQDKDDAALDLILDFFDGLLDGLFEQQFNNTMQQYGGPRILPEKENPNPNIARITEALNAIDVDRLSITRMIGVLIGSRPVKEIPAWNALYKRVESKLKKTETVARVNALIGNLK